MPLDCPCIWPFIFSSSFVVFCLVNLCVIKCLVPALLLPLADFLNYFRENGEHQKFLYNSPY
jgi:hypothetical protein